MPIIHTGAIPTGQLSSQMQIKRAVSGYIDTNDATQPAGFSPILYTSTAIVLTAINLYVVDEIQGAGYKLDVGINADTDANVDAFVIAATVADEVVPVTIGVATVAAGKVLLASTETVDGTGGTVMVATEYREIDV